MNETSRTETGKTGIGPGGAIAAGMLREMESWSSRQCEMLAGIGTIWTDWLRRQREAIDASARSLQQMCECRNVADLLSVQQQWLTESARRSAADVSQLASESAALTWRVAGAGSLTERIQGAVRTAARPKTDEPPPSRGKSEEHSVQRVAAE